ncbi:MAG: fructosamine kinase family protein [Melioribacteraceae bacterium]|nr:fructosamine kinase family protein [Melioribacteraceae bacterium]
MDTAKLQQILNEKISVRSIGGGSIAETKLIETVSGKKYLIKQYSGTESSIIGNEVNGLKELAKADVIRIPGIIYYDSEFLIIEYLTAAKQNPNFFEDFGAKFARLHKYRNDKFGFFENNFIGATPQKNLPPSDNWADFYYQNRLLYQFRLAEKNGYVDSKFSGLFDKLASKLDKILAIDDEEPSLLHGDLWSGNFIIDDLGEAALIDPAVYYGNREADLAMTKLFGGFPPAFYRAYDNEYPLQSGWEYRENIYKLYHVFNHLNLFGTGYLSQSLSLMKSYL